MPATFEQIMAAPVAITNIDASIVGLELAEPMHLSFGTFDRRPSGWLALEGEINGKPVCGYGEGATLPRAVFTDDSGENIAANMHTLAVSAGRSEGTVQDAIAAVHQYQFADGGSYPTARMTTEMALLDAATKAHDTSVRQAVGIPDALREVPYGKSIGGADTEAILRQAEEALALDAKKIKIKVSPALFDEVTEAITVLQNEYAGLDIMVDANGGFDPNDPEHLRMLATLDHSGLIMIEEPVSRVGSVRGLDAVRVLRGALPMITPVCLDDCLRTADDCEEAITGGLAEVINIKPGRIGSFLKGLELADFAAEQGAQVMVGGMLEGTPGRSMTTVLGAYCLQRGFTVPGDLSLAQERLSSDLVPAEKQLRLGPDGGILLPTGPGWGF